MMGLIQSNRQLVDMVNIDHRKIVPMNARMQIRKLQKKFRLFDKVKSNYFRTKLSGITLSNRLSVISSGVMNIAKHADPEHASAVSQYAGSHYSTRIAPIRKEAKKPPKKYHIQKICNSGVMPMRFFLVVLVHHCDQNCVLATFIPIHKSMS